MKYVFLMSLLMLGCGHAFGQGQLEISFPYNRLTGINNTQFAVWIENAEGAYVKTLYVTSYMGKGGFKSRKDALPAWVKSSKVKENTEEKIDAITGATPKTGQQKFVWDCTDCKDKKVAPGEYKYMVEGATRMGDRIICTGKITVGDKEAKSTVEPEYSTDAAKDAKAIGEVTAVYKP